MNGQQNYNYNNANGDQPGYGGQPQYVCYGTYRPGQQYEAEERKKKIILFSCIGGALFIGVAVLLILLLTGGDGEGSSGGKSGKGADTPQGLVDKFCEALNAHDADKLKGLISGEFLDTVGTNGEKLIDDFLNGSTKGDVKRYNVKKHTLQDFNVKDLSALMKEDYSDYAKKAEELKFLTLSMTETYDDGSQRDKQYMTYIVKIDGKWYLDYYFYMSLFKIYVKESETTRIFS